MELVKGEKTQSKESRFRLFKVKKVFVLFERSPAKKLPIRMRIFNERGNQELNTISEARISNQLKTIGKLFSRIKDGKDTEDQLSFIKDYDDPKITTQLMLSH